MLSKNYRAFIYGLIAALFILLVTGAMLYRFSSVMMKQADETMRNSLRRGAIASALAVNGDKHLQFTDVEQQNSTEYNLACERLENAKKSMQGPEQFGYVYTCIVKDGIVYFVLDPTPQGDADGDGVEDKAFIMQEYPEATKELMLAYTKGIVTVMSEPQNDIWGRFLSGYAPILNSTNDIVGVLGIDMNLDFYHRELAEIRKLTLLSALGLLFISLGGGYLVWFHEKRIFTVIEELILANQKAKTAYIAKDRFLSTMSHELRTPLNGVLGMTDVLLNTKLESQQREYIEVIRESGERLLLVLNDILDYTNLDLGVMSVIPKPVKIRPFLKKLTQKYERAAGIKDLSFAFEIDTDIPDMIDIDSSRVAQFLDNILSNAVKFTLKGGVDMRVCLVDSSPAKTIQFTVKDTGIGLSESESKQIGEPFMQVDSSATRCVDGTGLGLAICKRMAIAMGGDLLWESKLGVGSSFTLRLPLVISFVEDEIKKSGVSSEKIALVVSDDRLVVTLYSRMLEKLHFMVIHASSATDISSLKYQFTDIFIDPTDNAVFKQIAMDTTNAAKLYIIDSGLSVIELDTYKQYGVAQILPRAPSFSLMKQVTTEYVDIS